MYAKNTELYHHGVLGMKWGVRRYQSYAENPKLSDRKRKKIENKVEKLQTKKQTKLTSNEERRKVDHEYAKQRNSEIYDRDRLNAKKYQLENNIDYELREVDRNIGNPDHEAVRAHLRALADNKRNLNEVNKILIDFDNAKAKDLEVREKNIEKYRDTRRESITKRYNNKINKLNSKLQSGKKPHTQEEIDNAKKQATKYLKDAIKEASYTEEEKNELREFAKSVGQYENEEHFNNLIAKAEQELFLESENLKKYQDLSKEYDFDFELKFNK